MKNRWARVGATVILGGVLLAGALSACRLTVKRSAEVTAWVTACDKQMTATKLEYCTLPVP